MTRRASPRVAVTFTLNRTAVRCAQRLGRPRNAVPAVDRERRPLASAGKDPHPRCVGRRGVNHDVAEDAVPIVPHRSIVAALHQDRLIAVAIANEPGAVAEDDHRCRSEVAQGRIGPLLRPRPVRLPDPEIEGKRLRAVGRAPSTEGNDAVAPGRQLVGSHARMGRDRLGHPGDAVGRVEGDRVVSGWTRPANDDEAVVDREDVVEGGRMPPVAAPGEDPRIRSGWDAAGTERGGRQRQCDRRRRRGPGRAAPERGGNGKGDDDPATATDHGA